MSDTSGEGAARSAPAGTGLDYYRKLREEAIRFLEEAEIPVEPAPSLDAEPLGIEVPEAMAALESSGD